MWGARLLSNIDFLQLLCHEPENTVNYHFCQKCCNKTQTIQKHIAGISNYITSAVETKAHLATFWKVPFFLALGLVLLVH